MVVAPANQHDGAERSATATESGSWADIPGWEGLFQISLAGQVRSIPRVYSKTGGLAKTGSVRGKTLTPTIRDGRKWVLLGACGIKSFKSISVLMMAAFVGPRPDGMQVCHNDGNSMNDDLSNLRYDTPIGNAADRKLHGTHYVGSKTTNATLTEADIPHIRRSLAAGETQTAIAKRFGLKTIRAIGQIKEGKTWRHVL